MGTPVLSKGNLMSRRVVVTKKGGALGDRFDGMKKKNAGAGTERRRTGQKEQNRNRRNQELDQKRGKKKGGKKNNAKNTKKPLTAAELDAELEQYNLKNGERGKDYLDDQLD